MEKQNATDTDGFSREEWSSVDEVIKKNAGKPGALIPVLEEIQNILGFLPESVQRRVAKGLGLPLGHVYGVVTFYSFFTMQPRGRHKVRVCLGTACHVRGAKKNVERLEKSLGIDIGECTKNREFGLEAVRCLGACGLAPVMVVDDDTHRHVKESQIEQILRGYQEPKEQ